MQMEEKTGTVDSGQTSPSRPRPSEAVRAVLAPFQSRPLTRAQARGAGAGRARVCAAGKRAIRGAMRERATGRGGLFAAACEPNTKVGRAKEVLVEG